MFFREENYSIRICNIKRIQSKSVRFEISRALTGVLVISVISRVLTGISVRSVISRVLTGISVRSVISRVLICMYISKI